MKKKIGIISLLLLMISFINVSASTFTDYFPEGKNYLDENNIIVSNNSVSSVEGFLVKENTFYTLSIPGIDFIDGNLTVEVFGNDLYLGGEVVDIPNCSQDFQWTICTFETVVGEDYLELVISSTDINSYYASYGLYGFMLEEGEARTSYEEYNSPFEDITTPEFSGAGAYIKSYDTFESINNIISSHLVVIDEIDGDITSSVVIESDLYTGNEQIVGEYIVELSASDSSGNIANFSLTILVKDEIDPVITGPTDLNISISEITNVNKIITDYFTVNDDYSSTTTNILIDNYTSNKDTLGSYSVTFEVVDEDFNNITHIFNISLVDIDSPKIISDLNIDSYLSNPIDNIDAMETLEFSDNYDDMTGVYIDILSDQFLGNEDIPGTYIIVFEVSDNSGNDISGNLIINVIDDVLPVIIGPITYQGSYVENLSVSDFLNMMSVSDNNDSLSIDDLYIIEDTYSSRISSIGVFNIIFGLEDDNSNEGTHSIEITLFDDVAPIIYIDNYIVTVDMESTFTTDDALTLLINSNELTEGSYSVRTLFDGYTGNELKKGTYVYLLEFTNNAGESYEKEFLVKVIDDDDGYEINDELLIRNIIIYSVSIGFFGFVVFKNKK